jgi:hypothetical protein
MTSSGVIFPPGWPLDPDQCPDGPHRGPQGPNEDLAQCFSCLMPSWMLRPEGQEYGRHLADCSLPRRHESWCVGGGDGHPDAPVQRGMFE